MMTGVDIPPIVEQATRRGSVIWVALDGARPRPVWHVWHDGCVWLVVGGLEQQLVGAPGADRAAVAVRSKDRQGGLLVTWLAEVSRVQPGSAQWEDVVPRLHAARLNAPDGEQQPVRWARDSAVLCLRPTGDLVAPS